MKYERKDERTERKPEERKKTKESACARAREVSMAAKIRNKNEDIG